MHGRLPNLKAVGGRYNYKYNFDVAEQCFYSLDEQHTNQ
jgi:hypothetical protein